MHYEVLPSRQQAASAAFFLDIGAGGERRQSAFFDSALCCITI